MAMDSQPTPMLGSRPVPFQGTREEAAANRRTHSFAYDEDARCMDCDCRPGHRAADYPCGTTVPRQAL